MLIFFRHLFSQPIPGFRRGNNDKMPWLVVMRGRGMRRGFYDPFYNRGRNVPVEIPPYRVSFENGFPEIGTHGNTRIADVFRKLFKNIMLLVPDEFFRIAGSGLKPVIPDDHNGKPLRLP